MEGTKEAGNRFVVSGKEITRRGIGLKKWRGWGGEGMLAIRGGPLPVRNWILKVRESIAIRLRLIASFDLHADPGGRTSYKS